MATWNGKASISGCIKETLTEGRSGNAFVVLALPHIDGGFTGDLPANRRPRRNEAERLPTTEGPGMTMASQMKEPVEFSIALNASSSLTHVSSLYCVGSTLS
jgi:hypothetical protein